MRIAGRGFLWLSLVSLFFSNMVNAQVAGQELSLVREPTYISSQSQVVWHDNAWWGVFRRAGSGTEWKVFKYSGGSWSDNATTGITVGDAVDVYLDESNAKLYVFASSANRFSRLSYSGGSFTLDSGFPTVASLIPPPFSSQDNAASMTQALNGDLFIFWVGADTTGGYLMTLHSPDQGVTWSPDTIMATAVRPALTDAISFQYAGENYVGVFVGEGNGGKFSFLRLIDGGDPVTDWVEETLPDISGVGSADDHINLLKDANDNLYMIGKNGDRDDFFLFKRNNDGSWEDYRIRPAFGTRPALAIDETYGKLIILATVRRNGDLSNKIQYTVLDKDNLTDIVDDGLWVPALENGTHNFNDVTVSYQILNDATNLMVAATNTTTNPDSVWYNVLEINSNYAPALTPISAQNMNEGDTLDVAVSSADADGNNITLSVNNLPLFGNFTDNGDGTGAISFTTGFDDAGVYSNIEVVAVDNGSPSLSDTVLFTLTVNETNRSPILTSVSAQNMNEGETLDVNISSTDPDGNDLTLAVPNLPPFGNLTDNGDGTGMISFTTGFDDAGVYSDIEVISTDNGSPSLSDTVLFTLTVNNINRAPALTAIGAQVMDEGETLDVNISSTDPDGDNLTLTALNLPSFGSLTDNGDGTGTVSFAPDFDDAGVFSNIDVIVTDNGNPSLADTVTFTLTVNDVNRAPVLTPIAAQGMNENETLDVPVSSTDPEGNGITLSAGNLPSFGGFTDNGDGTGTISFTTGFDDAGVYSNIQVIATDNGSPSASDTVIFTLTVNNLNRAPLITAIAPQNTNEGDTLDVNVSSTDPDGNSITLMAENLPSFGSFSDNGDGTGSFRFTPGYDHAGSYPNVIVIAADNGNPTLSDTVTFTLTVNNVNRAPVLASISSQVMNEGDTLDVAVSSTDPDGNSISLAANNLPSFGGFTDNGDGTGSFHFMTTFGDEGVYPNIQVVATDNGNPTLSDTATFTLSVGNVNRAPVITPIADQNMNEGDTLDVAISSTDLDGDNITLSTNNLPLFGNLTDNGDGTGNLRFVTNFNNAGTYQNIEVTATDDGNPSLAATVSFPLTVNNVNRAPILAPITSQNMNEGEVLVVIVSSTDPDGDDITLIGGNLPTFGSFTNNGDGTGSFRFTPNFAHAGNYPNVRVVATDNGNPTLSDTVTFTLTVNNVNRAPVLTPINNLAMNEGETLIVPASSNDPDGNNITLTTNNLPSFAAFTDNGDGTGSFEFTPGFDHAGTYPNIELIATDNGSPALSDTISFQLTVNDMNRAPVLASVPPQSMNEDDTLDVAVSSIDPDGNNIILAANNVPSFGIFTDNGDGTGSFHFVTTFGDEGVYPNIQVVATDNGSPSLTDTVTFSLAVSNVNRAPILSSIPPQNMNENETLDVNVTSTDPDGDNITLIASNLPSFGNFTDNGDGTGVINFITDFNDAGVYSNIRIIAFDNASPSLSDTVLFTLTVNNVNRAPVLISISAQNMNEGDTLDVSVFSTDPDGDSIGLQADNLPPFGSLTDNGDGTGTIDFTPGFEDSGFYPNISVIATDNGNPSLTDTVIFTLTVGNTNQLPLAVDDVDTTSEDTAIAVNVLFNDSDPEGDTLFVMGITQGSNGTVEINNDSVLTYSPDSNFYGTDMFTYFISDGNGGSDTATVMMTIISVNDLPVIANLPDSVGFDADTTVTLNIWDFVEDVETPDSSLTFQFSANPDSLIFAYGNTTGLLVIGRVANFIGEVDVTIQVSDPDGGTTEDSLIVIAHPVVGIPDPFALQIPKEFVLMQNYPNPFNPVTNIRFGLPVASDVVIEIYNILGQRMIKLLEERKPAGYHVVQFDASQFGSGLYLYRIKADNFSEVKKMMLVR